MAFVLKSLFFVMALAISLAGATYSESSHFGPPALTGTPAQFGYTVAASGNWLVVCATGTDSNEGSAYVYQCPSQQSSTAPTPTNCTQLQILKPPQGAPNDTFGSFAVMQDDLLVIGAPLTNQSSGAMYLYTCTSNSTGPTTGGACTLSAEIANPGNNNNNSTTPPTAQNFDSFGYYVWTDDGYVVVGAPGYKNNTGAAYLFDCSDATACQMVSILTAPDGKPGDLFGLAVGIQDGLVAVGADSAADGRGAAYAFNCSVPESCVMLAELTADGHLNDSNVQTGAPSGFGHLIYVDGGMVYVGATGSNNRTGSVMIFDCSSGTNCSWLSTLLPVDAAMGDEFGSYIATLNNTLFVGAQRKNQGVGAVYLFDCSDLTACTQTQLLVPADGEPGDGWFGWMFAVTEEFLAVGSPFIHNSEGEAWVFVQSQNSTATP
jgi:hypothetical protein